MRRESLGRSIAYVRELMTTNKEIQLVSYRLREDPNCLAESGTFIEYARTGGLDGFRY